MQQFARLQAVLLGLSFVLATGMKTGHLLFHHEGHSALPCSARYEGANALHLHDERYAAEDCWVCAFWFALPDLPLSPALQSPPPRLWKIDFPLLLKEPNTAEPEQRHLRGPPMKG